jgi:hypothetical protein
MHFAMITDKASKSANRLLTKASQIYFSYFKITLQQLPNSLTVQPGDGIEEIRQSSNPFLIIL